MNIIKPYIYIVKSEILILELVRSHRYLDARGKGQIPGEEPGIENGRVERGPIHDGRSSRTR